MPIKTYRPLTPSLRFKTTLVNDDITADKPYKPLTVVKQRTGGRRNAGDLTMRHQGGGHKKIMRLCRRREAVYSPAGRLKGRADDHERPGSGYLGR